MKTKLWHLFIGCMILAITACESESDIVRNYTVSVQLNYPEGFSSKEGVLVKLENATTKVRFESLTDASGKASFQVIAGTYAVTAVDQYSESGNQWILSGNRSDIIVTDAWTEASAPIELSLSEAKQGQIVIKEYYFNGCQKDDGSGKYQRDPYVILYNNSDQPASLENLCFGATLVANSQANNNDYVNGSLWYAAENWVPAGYGIFYFANPVIVEPGKQVVVAMNGALNHTLTYSHSVDLSHADYYVFYDPTTGFDNTSYHPAPDTNIPESHYLKGIRYPNVTSNAYTMSVTSPAFFIFAPKGISPVDFAAKADNLNNYNGLTSQVRLKVPVEWVIDGVEVFQKGAAKNQKRLLPAVDAGYIEFPSVSQGYTLYRNVDKERTEALAANAGKLVYNYTGAVQDTNDPSGIDAEASIAAGARIIYKDTNNADADFHLRGKASLKK